jgi:lysophospholipase L1-like esterase
MRTCLSVVRISLLGLLPVLALSLSGCGSSPPITWSTPAPISYGTALSGVQLDASASVPGTFTYNPVLGTILDAGSQTLVATFAPDDPQHYAGASASVTLTVNPAIPVITWPAPAPLVYGNPLSGSQLNASASIPGSFAYSPAAGAILHPGSQNLSATFTPNDLKNYEDVTAHASLQVIQASPVLHWATPAPIAVNMPLSSSQLSITAISPVSGAPVGGSFVFSPPAGTEFSSPGDQQISAAFAPADGDDYTQATATTTITVLPFGVVAWGDSLTNGREGIANAGAYPPMLAAVITLPVVNEGVSGQTSTQIGVREGGIPTLATVTGGVIPGSGAVAITFPAGYEPVTPSSPKQGISGSIAGVHGAVTLSDNGLVFARSESGDSVTAPNPLPFVVDTPYSGYLPVFWEGRNDAYRVSQVLADIAAQVATVPAGQDYLVLSITNDDVPSERKGGTNYAKILALNNQLANIYGSHFLDVREAVVNAYDPSSLVDVSDFNYDTLPTSLRADQGSGTLGNSIGSSDTTFTVNLSKGTLAPLMILTIDTGSNAENVQINSVSGSTVTVNRDMGGNVFAHSAGAPVLMTDNGHLNADGYQVVAKAIAGYLSNYAESSRLSSTAPVSRPSQTLQQH